MTSRCHAVGLNQNLSTVSCEWDLKLWKNGIFCEGKKFTLKINAQNTRLRSFVAAESIAVKNAANCVKRPASIAATGLLMSNRRGK